MIIWFIPALAFALRSITETKATESRRIFLPSKLDCLDFVVKLDVGTSQVEVCPTSDSSTVLPGEGMRLGYLVSEEGRPGEKVFVKFHRLAVASSAVIAKEIQIHAKIADASYALQIRGQATQDSDKSFQLGFRGAHALPGLVFKADDYLSLTSYIHERFRNSHSTQDRKLFDCVFSQLLQASVDLAARGIRRPFLEFQSVYVTKVTADTCPNIKLVDFDDSEIVDSVDELDLFLATLLRIEQLANMLSFAGVYHQATPATVDYIIRTVKKKKSVRPEFVEDCHRQRTHFRGFIFQSWCGLASLFLD